MSHPKVDPADEPWCRTPQHLLTFACPEVKDKVPAVPTRQKRLFASRINFGMTHKLHQEFRLATASTTIAFTSETNISLNIRVRPILDAVSHQFF